MNPSGPAPFGLAVLDHGIGGLDVWRRLQVRAPRLSLIYLSDSGSPPYGQISRLELSRRLRVLARFLEERGADACVVACNAASSALPDKAALPLLGIIDSGLRSVRSSGFHKIGVIGGQRTIDSGVYETPLREEGFDVIARVAQPLSICVEAGDLNSPELHGHLDEILAPLSDREAVLLACTHYPALATQIAARLPGVALLDPAAELVAEVERRWSRHWTSLGSGGHPKDTQRVRALYTTGDPVLMERAASAAFGVDLGGPNVELIPIS